MMIRKNQKMAALVGMLIFIALLVLLIAVIWLGEYRLKPSGYQLFTRYDVINGLKEGDHVAISGVLIGEVVDIRFTGRDVLVSFNVDKTIRIPIDSRVVLTTGDVFGGRGLDIEIGHSAEYALPNDTLFSSVQPTVNDLVIMGEDLARATSDILDEDNRRNLSGILTNLEITINNLKELSDRDIPEISKRLVSISRYTDGIIGGNTNKIDTMIKSLSETAVKLNQISDTLMISSSDAVSTLGSIKSASANLDTILTTVKSGRGTLGRLVNDDSLYQRVMTAIANIDSLIVDVRSNPSKYIRIKLF